MSGLQKFRGGHKQVLGRKKYRSTSTLSPYIAPNTITLKHPCLAPKEADWATSNIFLTDKKTVPNEMRTPRLAYYDENICGADKFIPDSERNIPIRSNSGSKPWPITGPILWYDREFPRIVHFRESGKTVYVSEESQERMYKTREL